MIPPPKTPKTPQIHNGGQKHTPRVVIFFLDLSHHISFTRFRSHFRLPESCLPVARTTTAVVANTDVVGPAHAHAHLSNALEAATPARLGVGGPGLSQRQVAQREDAAQ
jgi:hypothetical protein